MLDWLVVPYQYYEDFREKKGFRPSPASLVPLDMEESSDSVVSGRFRLFPELLCVKTEADPEELN